MLTPDAPHLSGAASVAEKRPRVLLIEDDPLQARGLLRLLDLHGIEAHVVHTAEAGLQAAISQPSYDAIISDLGLPDLPGAEIGRRLRGPLLIAYSGAGERPDWFDAALSKPAVAELLTLVRGRRVEVALTQLPGGDCLGVYKPHGLRRRGRSPAHVLRLLATALESLH